MHYIPVQTAISTLYALAARTVLQVISWRLCRHAAYERHNKTV